VKRYGNIAEKVMYGRATNIAKKTVENMNKDKVREMIKKTLMSPIEEKFTKEFDTDPALKGGQRRLPDELQNSIIKKAKNEDIDLGHQDDEPDMLKASVYRIAQYAAGLYKMLDKYDQMNQEVDFPDWWQEKIHLAADYMDKAKHYLEFEEKQPALDAMIQEEKGEVFKSKASKIS
jgi:superfamily I DNA/RNA helicase